MVTRLYLFSRRIPLFYGESHGYRPADERIAAKVEKHLMKHVTIEDGIDYANQVLPTARRLEIEEHLKTCVRCAKAISRWRRVRQDATVEADYQPPPEAVRIAKATFVALELALRRAPRSSPVEMVFDSLLQPLEGLRSTGGVTRHVLYRADPFQVDLQLELQPAEKRVVVTGQLLGSRDPQIVGRNVGIMLANQRGGVVRTVTNQFGEFRAEIEKSDDLTLVFYRADDKPVVISLREALGQMSNKEKKSPSG